MDLLLNIIDILWDNIDMDDSETVKIWTPDVVC